MKKNNFTPLLKHDFLYPLTLSIRPFRLKNHSSAPRISPVFYGIMNTAHLKKIAGLIRRKLMEQVECRLNCILLADSPERRTHAHAVAKLEEELITPDACTDLIERVAYTWFNRFCALRYMEARGLTPIRAISAAEGQSQPEILSEAKLGIIDEKIVPDPQRRQHIMRLLTGAEPGTPAPQEAAYRLLLFSTCNYWAKYMPYIFRKIEDYAQLLMPDDLLSPCSVLKDIQGALTPQSCAEGVEILGWLYQYYIAEKKDRIFKSFKQGGKADPADIPAATELFTPKWIVRYMTQNSLGRLWALNHPHSALTEQMEFFIRHPQHSAGFLRLSAPEELKVCDPACGSGHILCYAFDLLYAIYEEEGYAPSVIPELILTHNLYGLELDERAGQMAAFALTMKACEKQKNFLRKKVRPHICVPTPLIFTPQELNGIKNALAQASTADAFLDNLTRFTEADNFGSLIRVKPTDIADIGQRLTRAELPPHTAEKALRALDMCDYLSAKYNVVIANPPYMGKRNMNARLNAWLKEHYPDVKTDLFSAFIQRNMELCRPGGQLGFMTPFVWMFITSYEKLRKTLITEKLITSLVQLEYSAFEGATVPICAFTVENGPAPNVTGAYIRLTDFHGIDNQAPQTLHAIRHPDCGWFYRAQAAEFFAIPGAPIAYWLSDAERQIFRHTSDLSRVAVAKQGMATGANNRFLRYWHEVDYSRIGFGLTSKAEAFACGRKWFPYNKGGGFRKWYGHQEQVICFTPEDYAILKTMGNHCPSERLYFKPSVSWGLITSATNAFRYYPPGFVFDVAGMSAFGGDEDWKKCLLAYCNTAYAQTMAKTISATLNFPTGDFGKLPYPEQFWSAESAARATRLIEIAKEDWDNEETSWDFATLPLLRPQFRADSLASTYEALRRYQRALTDEMRRLEEENNRHFNSLYLPQEPAFTAAVPLERITLHCNPAYRYGPDKSAEEQEALLLADSMRTLISYAVGCMFGRFSLHSPGLILADGGADLSAYRRFVPCPATAILPVADNVISLTAEGCLKNDIVTLFGHFLSAAFGPERLTENIRFIENALNRKGKRNYDIRDYFLNEFYDDHVKRYSQRPLYWLFSSKNGTFKALIYLHRYRPDTPSGVLNDYLRAYRQKLAALREQIESLPTPGGADRKRLDALLKAQKELAEYENDVLFPLAQLQPRLNLDDGVIANHAKLAPALPPLR